MTLGLTAFALQTFGAWYTGSLALWGDTAHLFTDLLSLSMSLTAVILAARPANHVQSFGLYRLEVLAAFLNGILLLVVACGLGYESFERIRAPREVLALPLFGIASAGLLLNLLSAWVLASALKGEDLHAHHGHSHSHGHDDHPHDHDHQLHDHADRNLNSAFLHVLSDAMSSVAVMVGAGIVYFTGYSAADAVIGLLLALVIFYWAYRLILDTGHVLLEATPRHIEVSRLIAKVKGLDARILAVEDLHIWEITSRMYAATAEIKVEMMNLSEAELLRQKMNDCLMKEFGIAHVVLALRAT
jgi:cobalt-zinc-cadmium efflux system protein